MRVCEDEKSVLYAALKTVKANVVRNGTTNSEQRVWAKGIPGTKLVMNLNLRNSETTERLVSSENSTCEILHYDKPPIPCLVTLSDPNKHDFFTVALDTRDASTNKDPRARISGILKGLKMEHFNEKRQQMIRNLCVTYADVFFVEGNKRSFYNLESQKIVLKPDARQYRIPIDRFLGFINYYGRSIKDFADLAKLFVKLLRTTIESIWTEECNTTFKMFRRILASDLTTDTSKYQMGYVLSDHDRRIVAHASHRLNDAEIRYPPIDEELLGIVWGIKHHISYLWGNFYRVGKDHQPLQYLLNQETPSVRLVKFQLSLQEFDFKIIYEKGADNKFADALSRSHQSEILCFDNYALIATINMVQTRSKERLSKHSDSETADDHNLKPDQPEVVEVPKPPHGKLPKLIFFETSEELVNFHDSELRKTQSSHVGVYKQVETLLIRIPHAHTSSKSLCSLKKDLTKICEKFETSEVLLLQNELEKITGTPMEKRKILSKICKNTPPRVSIVPNTSLVRSCATCQRSKHGKLPRQPLTVTSTSTHTFDEIHFPFTFLLAMRSFTRVFPMVRFNWCF